MAHRATRTRRRFLATTASLAAGATLTGCVGGGAGGDGDDDDGLPDRVEVTMTTTPTPMFEPRLAHVGVDGTVVWRLESGSHDTVAYHPDTYGPARIPSDAEPWASETLSSVGDTFERTFETAGVYDYVDTEAVCVAHEVVGNVGRVVVGWPDYDPDAQPALRPPQEELPSIAQGKIEDLNDETRALLRTDRTTTAR